jgi:hypothetical protein
MLFRTIVIWAPYLPGSGLGPFESANIAHATISCKAPPRARVQGAAKEAVRGNGCRWHAPSRAPAVGARDREARAAPSRARLGPWLAARAGAHGPERDVGVASAQSEAAVHQQLGTAAVAGVGAQQEGHGPGHLVGFAKALEDNAGQPVLELVRLFCQ